jgi:hypothetical protein
MQGSTGGARLKAPDWFVSTWAVVSVGVVYGMRDGLLERPEALTALGLAVGWALARGAFVMTVAKPDRE